MLSDEFNFYMVAMCLSDEGWSTRENCDTYTLAALKSGYTSTINCAKKTHPDQPNDLYNSKQIEEGLFELSVHLAYTGKQKLTPWNTFVMDPVLVEYVKRSIVVLQHHYETLAPEVWLADEVIDFVLLIAVNEIFRDQYVFPTTFTQTLNDNEEDLHSGKKFDIQSLTSSLIVSSRKFLNAVKGLPKLGTFRKIYFPFNIAKCHWALIFIDVVNRRIFLLDSLLTPCPESTKTLENVLFYLQDKLEPLTVTDAQYVPKQPNGFDCGLYSLFFALALASTESNCLPAEMPDSEAMRNTFKDFIWKRSTTERTKTKVDYDFGEMRDIMEPAYVSDHRSIPSQIDALETNKRRHVSSPL